MEVKSTEPWRFIPSKERLEKMFTHEEETFEEEKLNELFQIGGDLDPTSWTAKSPAELKADEQARLNAEEDRLRGDLLDKNNRLLGLRQPEWTGNIDTSSLKPFDKDLYEQKPDEKQLWVYYPYKDSGGYEMPNRNSLEAFSSADAVYSDLKTTGSRYWIPAFRKLDTLQRGLLALQGDPKGVTELLRREARDDYKKNLAWVKRQRLPTIGGAAQPMDDDTAEWIANHITLAEHYAFAMPNYMYSASGRLLGGIDSVLNIIPQWDGLLIDTLVAVANDTQEGFALEEKIEDQVLGQDSNSGIYILDDDIFGPTTTALTHHSPFARMSADELEGMIKHSEDPNLTTKIIRTFLDEFGIVASLVMGVGTGSNILGWGARMERTALLALEKKGIKASEKTVLQEMRNIIQATYKEQIKETQTKITPWLKKQYDLARSEWYLNPIKYLNDLAQTEGAFVAVILDWTGAYPDPEAYLTPLLSCNEIKNNTCLKGEAVFSGSFWGDKKVQQLLEKSEELEGESRLKNLKEIEKIAAQGAAYLPIWLVSPKAWSLKEISKPEFSSDGLIILKNLKRD